VARHGITRFHDIRGDEGGICHQILPENGYVRPGAVVVGTDSHTTSHGALGAFAFGIGATEMASVWALGVALNVEVPRTIRVEVSGAFAPGVGPKDLILHLVGCSPPRAPTSGSSSSTARRCAPCHFGRLTLCNMSVEAAPPPGSCRATRRRCATCARSPA